MKCPRAIQPAEFILLFAVFIRKPSRMHRKTPSPRLKWLASAAANMVALAQGHSARRGAIQSVEAFVHADTLNNLPARALSRLAVFNRAVAA